MIPQDIISKQITYAFNKIPFTFDVSSSLFSSFDIDKGTKLLLKSLVKNNDLDYSSIADVGCGYGPIGIILKKIHSQSEVTLIDRDQLAVEFATHNSQLNNVIVDIVSGLDFDPLKNKKSLIISNFPAKLEGKGLEQFVFGASHYLTQKGQFCFIIVEELETQMMNILSTHTEIKVNYLEKSKGYVIYHLSYDKQIEIPKNCYKRGELHINGSKSYLMRTSYGIDEYDTLGFDTLCFQTLLSRLNRYESVFILEPGQGHSAVIIKDSWNSNIHISTRDLLSLGTTQHNLKTAGYIDIKYHLQGFLTNSPKEDVIIWHLKSKSDLNLHLFNLSVIKKSDKPVLLIGEERLLKKILQKQKYKVLDKESKKKHQAILLKFTQ